MLEKFKYACVRYGIKNDESIFFVHVPKTAGSSIGYAISKNFKSHARCPITDEYAIIEASKKNELERYKFFSAHCGSAAALPVADRLVTVLRSPIDRIISLYNFWKSASDKIGEKDSAIRIAKSHSFSDFIRSEIPRITEDLHDAQTYQIALSNKGYGRKAMSDFSDKDIVEIAKNRLKSFDVVGIVEDMDTFHNQMWSISRIVTRGKYINRTKESYIQKADIDASDMRFLEEITRMDQAVYDAVKSGEIAPDLIQIEKRKKNKPGFTDVLALKEMK